MPISAYKRGCRYLPGNRRKIKIIYKPALLLLSKYINIYIRVHLKMNVMSSPRQLQQIRRNADGRASQMFPGERMYAHYNFKFVSES